MEVDQDGGEYEALKRQSQKNLGVVVDAKIPNAKKAFQVPFQGLTGMLVKGQYVQVVVTVPTASTDEVRAVAVEVAANVSDK